MAVNFVTMDRETPDIFPATVQESLTDDHLARFVVEVVDRLDPSRLVAVYAGTGSRAYHPAILVALLFYGYASGVFSSRKLAQSTNDSIAFRDICANIHPDHPTIADYRKRFLDKLAGLFTEVQPIPRTMGLVKLCTVSLDGTKIHQCEQAQGDHTALRQRRAGSQREFSWSRCNPPSLVSVVPIISTLGGFLDRKGDGFTGPKTLWIGLQRVPDFVLGLEAARSLRASAG